MNASFERARFNMIEQQIRPWEVLDERVLQVMGRLPREVFVPAAYRDVAYADIEIPLGADDCMLPPKLVGRLLQALAIQPGERVLEIGTGSGYVSACLAWLGARVRSLEIDSERVETARSRLAAFADTSVEIHVTDALAGELDGGPFAAIAVTGSLPTAEPLARLRERLADGGRLFAIVGMAPVMRALLVTRVREGSYREEARFETCVPALKNAPLPSSFTF